MISPPKHILPVIVLAQFCCTSLWFAGNGVMDNLIEVYQLETNALGHLTSAVQFGFITGTLVFALLSLADRYAPSRVFFFSALLAAAFNWGMILNGHSLTSLIGLRFGSGFFLAGVYPVGMKIAADYYDRGLGKSLGFLVGALVLGTAFPHLLKGFTEALSWDWVLIFTTVLAALGGIAMLLFVPDGPFRKPVQKIDLATPFRLFRRQDFRAAAFGYFGHMWELYAFWAFVPLILATYLTRHPSASLNVPLWSFIIIASGGLACVVGGYVSQHLGVKRTAALALMLSGICCMLSPLIFLTGSTATAVGFLIFWGMTVVADSPLFSTLVAQNVPAESKGSALTIVNCIGFSITIVSIQLLTYLISLQDIQYLFVLLALGPIWGLWSLLKAIPAIRHPKGQPTSDLCEYQSK